MYVNAPSPKLNTMKSLSTLRNFRSGTTRKGSNPPMGDQLEPYYLQWQVTNFNPASGDV